MTTNKAKPPSQIGKWKWHANTTSAACTCTGLKDAMRQSQGNIVALPPSLVRWESLRDNSSEEWVGVKKGETRVPLGHLSGSQQKKPEPTGMQACSHRDKNFIWQLVRWGYSSVSSANGYKRWEANSEITQCAVCHFMCLCFVYFGTARADKVGADWEHKCLVNSDLQIYFHCTLKPKVYFFSMFHFLSWVHLRVIWAFRPSMLIVKRGLCARRSRTRKIMYTWASSVSHQDFWFLKEKEGWVEIHFCCNLLP